MARSYTPTPGGWKWNQKLVENRRRNREVGEILERLLAAATTDATRVLVLRARVMCAENLIDLEELLAMARGGEAAAGEN